VAEDTDNSDPEQNPGLVAIFYSRREGNTASILGGA
jgi:hypothetical protein